MLYALAASPALAAVMTLGDFGWAALHIHHRTAYGITHGAVMCLCIGLAIGIRAGRILPAAIAGPLIGVLAAGTFYLLAPTLKWAAMFPAWMLLWIVFALVQKRLARRERIGATMKRGILAALLSGFAFYLISDIWIHEARHPSMLVHFGAWTFAFLPGFASLFAQQPTRVMPSAHRQLALWLALAAAVSTGFTRTHADPSTAPLGELARVRGAMWSARLDLPFGPRPGRPDNVIATTYFDSYSREDQTRAIAALKARGYTHVVAGPLVDVGGYHHQFRPHDWRGAEFTRFLDQLQTFWDNGLTPIVFIHPDGWTFERTRDELTPLLRQDRAQRLIRIAVPTGWEPTRHGWSSCTWAAFAEWARQTLPNALVLIHTASDADAPSGRDARCTDVDSASAWARVAPFIHGWLIQNGPFTAAPDGDARLARNFAAQFKGPNPTRDSAWGRGIPIRLYAGEQTAYTTYWKNMPEAASRAWGDLAMASGADGYLDGGTVDVPQRR